MPKKDLSYFRDFGGCSAITASIFECFIDLTPDASISNLNQVKLVFENSHLLKFKAKPSLSNLDRTSLTITLYFVTELFDTFKISSTKQYTPCNP